MLNDTSSKCITGDNPSDVTRKKKQAMLTVKKNKGDFEKADFGFHIETYITETSFYMRVIY